MNDKIFFMDNRVDDIENLNQIYKMIEENEIENLKSQIKALKTWYKEHAIVPYLVASEEYNKVFSKIEDKTLFYLHGLRQLAEIKTREELSII